MLMTYDCYILKFGDMERKAIMYGYACIVITATCIFQCYICSDFPVGRRGYRGRKLDQIPPHSYEG